MPHTKPDKDIESALDEALAETFPASDPVAVSGTRERRRRLPAEVPQPAKAGAKLKPRHP